MMDRNEIIQRGLMASTPEEIQAALPDLEKWLTLKPGDEGVQAAIDQMAQILADFHGDPSTEGKKRRSVIKGRKFTNERKRGGEW